MLVSKSPREAGYIQKQRRCPATTKNDRAGRLRLRLASTLLLCTMLALLVVFGSSAASDSSHAYAVSVDGEQVAVLVSRREADEAVALAMRQEGEKLSDGETTEAAEELALDFENELSIEAVTPQADEYTSVPDAAAKLAQELDFTAECVELLIDGERACYLATSTDAIEAVNAAKAHYGAASAADVLSVYTEQQISFNNSTAALDELLSVAEAANLLVYGDVGSVTASNAAPLIDVVVERSLSEVAALPYATIRVDDDTMSRGQETVVTPGVDGTQEITYTLIERNGQVIGKQQTSAQVLTAAVDEVVNVGTRLVVNGYGVIDLEWPLKDGVGSVSSRFGWRSRGWHSGLDVANAVGTVIVASEAGVVTYAEYEGGGHGNLIIIDHGEGLSTRYAHCDEFHVAVGDQVERGQDIGTVGMTGTTTGPHVHFEVRVDGQAVDPAAYIGVE